MLRFSKLAISSKYGDNLKLTTLVNLHKQLYTISEHFLALGEYLISNSSSANHENPLSV